jgi:hypothetical protein
MSDSDTKVAAARQQVAAAELKYSTASDDFAKDLAARLWKTAVAVLEAVVQELGGAEVFLTACLKATASVMQIPEVRSLYIFCTMHQS